MLELSYQVPWQRGDVRLYVFLREQGVTAGLIKAVKYRGAGFCADGVPVHTDCILRAGQTVSFFLPPDPPTTVEPQELPVNIVWENELAVVLNKPAGLAVHPTLNYPDHTLANGWLYLLAQRGEQGVFRPVNRLDKNTSGLVLCAKNSFAAAALAHTAEKRYLAVAEGCMPPGEGIIDRPIARRGDSIIGRCVDPGGKPSVTRYRVLASGTGAALVLCEPITGRTHQIRVHMASIGHPLAGDPLYGGHTGAIGRHALHCAALRFHDPLTGELISTLCELPPDLAQCCAAYGLGIPADLMNGNCFA